MGFKERLRDEIEYRGLLIKEVSAALGISNSTFLSYVDARGVLPNVETAVKIAKYLGVSVEYLVEGESPSEKNPNHSFQSEKMYLNEIYEKLSAHDKEILIKIAEALGKWKTVARLLFFSKKRYYGFMVEEKYFLYPMDVAPYGYRLF